MEQNIDRGRSVRHIQKDQQDQVKYTCLKLPAVREDSPENFEKEFFIKLIHPHGLVKASQVVHAYQQGKQDLEIKYQDELGNECMKNQLDDEEGLLKTMKGQKGNILIVITMYNESVNDLRNTLSGIQDNLFMLAECEKSDKILKRIGVVIVQDGRQSLSPEMVEFMTGETGLTDVFHGGQQMANLDKLNE